MTGLTLTMQPNRAVYRGLTVSLLNFDRTSIVLDVFKSYLTTDLGSDSDTSRKGSCTRHGRYNYSTLSTNNLRTKFIRRDEHDLFMHYLFFPQSLYVFHPKLEVLEIFYSKN